MPLVLQQHLQAASGQTAGQGDAMHPRFQGLYTRIHACPMSSPLGRAEVFYRERPKGAVHRHIDALSSTALVGASATCADERVVCEREELGHSRCVHLKQRLHAAFMISHQNNSRQVSHIY